MSETLWEITARHEAARKATVASEPVTQEQRARLKQLAEQATPGPWVSDPTLPSAVYSSDATGSMVAECRCKYTQRPIVEENANAAYIAAASPDVVLALLTALTAVTAERDRLCAALDALVQATLHARHGMGTALDAATDVLASVHAPTGHTHPRPCSICRREDCTTEHACE